VYMLFINLPHLYMWWSNAKILVIYHQKLQNTGYLLPEIVDCNRCTNFYCAMKHRSAGNYKFRIAATEIATHPSENINSTVRNTMLCKKGIG